MTSRILGERVKTPYDLCLDWIYDTKSKVETAKYGKNKASVRDAIREQTLMQQTVMDYEKEVNAMLNKTSDETQKQGLKDAYQKLTDVTQQKLNCLNTMLEISTLEEHCSNLGETFDRRAVKLVENQLMGRDPDDENNAGFIAPSSQDCVFATEDNWNWLSTLIKCLDVHLKNDAQYQQFFHECDESSIWMLQDLKRLHDAFEISPLKGDWQDAERLSQELKDITVALRQWEVKTDYLWEQARRVVPVQLRVSPSDEPLPARALCIYETKQGKIRENEDLLVINNTDPQQWTVRNARGDEFSVPALTILIPGPFKEAIDAAVKMRLQLMAAWTDTLKRVGQRLIKFMLLVFKNRYEKDEISTLKSIPNLERNELWRVLDFVEDTLKVHWSDHKGFQALQERITMLRVMLEDLEDKEADEESYKALVVQIMVLEQLMQKYKDLWREWETYKTALEASRAPELMLIVDKWEQLKFVSRDYFAKFWQNALPLDDLAKLTDSLAEQTADITEVDGSYGEGSSGEGVNVEKISTTQTVRTAGEGSFGEGEGSFGEGEGSSGSGYMVEKINTQTLQSANEGSFGEGEGSSGSGYMMEKIQTQTLRSANEGSFGEGEGSFGEGEGSSGSGYMVEKISSQDVKSSAGKGTGRKGANIQRLASETEESFEEGMMEEGIEETTVGYSETSAAVDEIEGSDFGMATERKVAQAEQLCKAEREETKRFVIRSVMDPESEEEVSLDEAILKGIINPSEGIYNNKKTGETFPIPVAMGAGLIKVEFTTTKRTQEKKSTIGIITVKTIRETVRPYNVKTVKDTKANESVNREEAIKRGIIDDSHGVYVDTAQRKKYLLTDAIEKGFMEVDYIGEAPPPEVIAQTYAVRSVVDRFNKRVITFGDAVRKGIIDRDTGAYLDTSNGEKMYVGDAIARGFLKARKIDDASGLDIDPENKLVIDKTEKIRQKILRPLRVLGAFKKAAKIASNNK